jgi:WhiB family redox-sensing transcriptional regulator
VVAEREYGDPLQDLVELIDLAWQDDANCMGANADLFFPERGASTRKAKQICGECEVQVECLEYAIANGEKFGIWGGLSERERRRIRKERSLSRQRRAV